MKRLIAPLIIVLLCAVMSATPVAALGEQPDPDCVKLPDDPRCASDTQEAAQADTSGISAKDRVRRDAVCNVAVAIQNDPDVSSADKRYWRFFIRRHLTWAEAYGPVCPELG